MGLFWDAIRKEGAREVISCCTTRFLGKGTKQQERGRGKGAWGCASDQGAKSQAQCLRSARKKKRHSFGEGKGLIP